MFVNRLLTLFAGYLLIRFRGERVERFINLCLQSGIPLWDIHTSKQGTVLGKTTILGFKQMRPAARRSRVSVRIERRRGLPFVMAKLWKRTAFSVGALMFIASLYLMGSIIWFVDVKGTDQLPTSRIIQAAAELGIRPGAVRSRLMVAELSRELVLKLPEISWAGVELKGSRASIEIVEKRVVTPDPRPIGSIVAEKSGVIKKIVATAGKSLVKAGDTVNQGQLLISGAFQVDVDEEVRYVHAAGIVEARVWYEGMGTSSLRRAVKRRTGREYQTEVLVVPGGKITLKGPNNVPFAQYELESQSLPLIWRSLGAAVEHRVMTYYEVVEEYEQVSFAVAKQEALDLAEQQARAQLPPDIQSENLVVQAELLSDQNTVRVRAVLETTEAIGKFAELGEP